MDRISEIFSKRKPLIVFTTAGYPSLEQSEEGMERAIAAGADILELGTPFSDPMADGPVIASASREAVRQGVGLSDVLKLAGRIRARHPGTGLILFSYMNPMLHYGYDALCKELQKTGVDGILPVDLPLEERSELLEPCRAHGLHLIPLVSPLTPPDRVRQITQDMTGFVYFINVAGVTGARKKLPDDFPEMIRAVKSQTDLPVASGFGIADPETAAQAARFADGVICGSAFVSLLKQGPDAAGDFVRSLADAVRSVR